MSLESCQDCSQSNPECIILENQMKSARANLFLLLTRQLNDLALPFQKQFDEAKTKLDQIRSQCKNH